jgi:hypothetical protein
MDISCEVAEMSMGPRHEGPSFVRVRNRPRFAKDNPKRQLKGDYIADLMGSLPYPQHQQVDVVKHIDAVGRYHAGCGHSVITHQQHLVAFLDKRGKVIYQG